MPKYTVTCRGGLGCGDNQKKTGSVVEMSEKDAASLPPGTVEALKSEPVKAEPKKEK
jgi:hypothetical protein